MHSEPVIAEAATRILLHPDSDTGNYLLSVIENLRSSWAFAFVDPGYRGELVARFILSLAKDSLFLPSSRGTDAKSSYSSSSSGLLNPCMFESLIFLLVFFLKERRQNR